MKGKNKFMKKIVIILKTHREGGMHNVACIQANELSRQGYDVTFLTLVESITLPYFISKNVRLISLLKNEDIEASGFISKVKRCLLYLPFLMCFLKKSSPDVILSHGQGMNLFSIISAKLLSIPIVCCEHTGHNLPYGFRGKLAYLERRYIYPFSSIITVLTPDEQQHYKQILENVELLPNPLPFNIINKKELSDFSENREKTILAVGDLNRINIKGWDTLLDVFVSVNRKHPLWRLQFAGGSNKCIGLTELKQKAIKLGVINDVDFLGSVTEIERLYQKAGIFILSSRNEGFPLVILEAKSQGCPVIAFNCKSGPSELIENNVDGLLIENQNIEAMKVNLFQLMESKELRDRLAMNSLETAKKFNKKIILNKLVSILERAAFIEK